MTGTLAHTKTLEFGSREASRSVVIFHGYTASPDEFRALGELLAQRLDAHVLIPLLPGHGTDEHELLNVSFEDLLSAARNAVAQEKAAGRSISLIGHSFGGYLALLIAAGTEISSVVLSVTPYALRLRFALPWTAALMRTKKFWDKELSAEELTSREGLFFYPHMPGIALTLLKEGIARAGKVLPGVVCPILTIHNTNDPITSPESGRKILARSGHNPLNRSIVLEHDSHGLYYGPHSQEVLTAISDFLVRATQEVKQ